MTNQMVLHKAFSKGTVEESCQKCIDLIRVFVVYVLFVVKHSQQWHVKNFSSL